MLHKQSLKAWRNPPAITGALRYTILVMDTSYWQKQTKEKPLFPDLIWNRPENRLHAGKLLVIGGNLHEFKAPADAYGEAMKARAGAVRVLLPNTLSKTVGSFFPEAEFVQSTPSGSFATEALAELLAAAAWADGVLLAGDFGRNSETAILLEKFLEKYRGQLTLTKDAVDYFVKSPETVLQRPDTTLVLSFSQLQPLMSGMGFQYPLTFSMGLLKFIEALHHLTEQYHVNILTCFEHNMCVGVKGQISTTKLENPPKIWRIKTAAHASTWWLQNPNKPYDALSTAVLHP